jgi:hypothetical protein
MKTKIVGLLLVFSSITIYAQNIPVQLTLKDGQSIKTHHFGQVDCSGKSYFDNYILIKGKYNNLITELKEYSKISKIELVDFEAPSKLTGDNEKGKIIVTRKNGVSVTLDDATISLSCYGIDEKINQLQFQMINPLTDEIDELKVDTKDIISIEFL